MTSVNFPTISTIDTAHPAEANTFLEKVEARLDKRGVNRLFQIAGLTGAFCVGKPAARAKAFFAAANDSEQSWKSRIWNGIKGVGQSLLAGGGSLLTIAVGIVVATPLIVGLGAGLGIMGGIVGTLAGPAGTGIGLMAGASIGTGMALYVVARDAAQGVREGYRWQCSAQASRPGNAYFPLVNNTAQPPRCEDSAMLTEQSFC